MPVDLPTAQLIAGIIASAIIILATFFGWFSKAWMWLRSTLSRKGSATAVQIPSRTMIVLAAHPSRFWWHMGSSSQQPAMQIVGTFTVTNICQYKVAITVVKLRKPKAWGLVTSPSVDEDDMLDRMCVGEVDVHFWVIPPVLKEGRTFKADVALLDQFGNEHWVKGIEFPYR